METVGDAPANPTFLRNDDFAGKLTPARRVPTRLSTPDEIALWHLANRTLWVDTEAGFVFRRDAITRAETPRPDGNGMVYLGRIAGKVRWARAHRVVWIARYGPIPGTYRIAHANERPWDNRIANLLIASQSEMVKHARASSYVGDLGEDDRPDVHPYVTGSIIEPRKTWKARASLI